MKSVEDEVFARKLIGSLSAASALAPRSVSVSGTTKLRMIDSTTLLAQLASYTPESEADAASRARIARFVDAHPTNWWQRQNLDGHVTGSAFVVNADRSHALLLFHASLGKWLQPGGHIDDEDDSPLATARRETQEEAGLHELQLVREVLFDLDAHDIPARDKDGRHEPAHVHYDLRYLFVATQDEVQLSAESLGFRWVPLSELLAESIEDSIQRMARKAHSPSEKG